jgi:lipopolysaccharide export LptBFGC system permease protein LptF
MNPTLTPVPPPRYGRRAIFSVGAAVVFTAAFFCIRIAAANQVGASEVPATWALYLAAVALYYAVICLFLWRKAQKVKG